MDAQNYAESASGYASDAQGYATTASQKATAASQSEEAARGYAQTASEKADSITGLTATAATLEAGSSATASYADGVLTLGIPRGADGDDGYSPTVSVTEITGGHEVSITDAQGTQTFDVMDGDDYVLTAEDKSDIADIVKPQVETDILKAFPTDTASGAVASFTDGADGLPLKSFIVNIDPVQDLSQGDPSPENICPISGWTGMEIQHNSGDYTLFGVTTGKTLNASGEVISESGMGVSEWMPVNTGDVVTLKYTSTSAGRTRRVIGYDANKAFVSVLSSVSWANVGREYTQTVTVQDGIKYIRACFLVADTDKSFLNESSITTIPINWQTEAGIVYSGKLDVLAGKLTVYPEYDPYNGETLTGRWISDRDVYAVGTTPTIGAQVVNIGAEGTEIQLEPHEIASILGANNIFADTGDSEVEYRADTKLYIERLTAPDSADMIADANIVSGQYFMVGNTLYKATANIANGGQITVGTNCTRVSLAQALNEINA